MKGEDALRKIEALRRVSNDKGASVAERITAYRLQRMLTDRYAVQASESDAPREPISHLHWGHWQLLFDEFNLELRHFGSRGSAELGHTRIAYVQLSTGEWWIDQKSPSGWRTTKRDRGFDSLRKFLKEHAPRSYSFHQR